MKLTKIVLEAKGKKVEMSLEEAKELYHALDDILGDKTTIVSYPCREPYPYRPTPYWYQDQITCNSGTTATFKNDNISIE